MATAVAEPANRSEQSLEDEMEAELQAANEAPSEHDAAAHNERAERLRERIVALKGEAGDATDPSDPAAEAAEAQRRDEEAEELAPEDIVVRGIDMSYPAMGGKAPTKATLTLTGTKVKLAEGTALKKGMTISGRFVAVVNDVGQKDDHDAATQQVTGNEARHKARLTDLVIDL